MARWTGRDEKHTVENHDYVTCINTQAKMKDDEEEKMTAYMTLQGSVSSTFVLRITSLTK